MSGLPWVKVGGAGYKKASWVVLMGMGLCFVCGGVYTTSHMRFNCLQINTRAHAQISTNKPGESSQDWWLPLSSVFLWYFNFVRWYYWGKRNKGSKGSLCIILTHKQLHITFPWEQTGMRCLAMGHCSWEGRGTSRETKDSSNRLCQEVFYPGTRK